METKNKFFANYFINFLDDLKIEIEKFGNEDESYFGAGLPIDKTKSKEEQEKQYLKGDHILESIEYLYEQWDKCVYLNKQEGYPVIDTYIEERDGFPKIH